jgi:hypothetical protein
MLRQYNCFKIYKSITGITNEILPTTANVSPAFRTGNFYSVDIHK